MTSPVPDGGAHAVLFDAGGILVLPDPTVLSPLLVPYGGDPEIEAHRRAHYAGMAAKSRAASDEGDWDSYNRAYVTTVGVDAELIDRAADLLGRTRSADLWRWPIADSVRALRSMELAGVPMSVVSNASGQIEWALAHAGICQVGSGVGINMRTVVDSEVVGVAKPDPKIFGFALRHHDDADLANVIYVGDSVTMDVGGARAAGLHPVLLDPFDDHVGADFARIRSLTELADLLV
ncbi:MAG: HAD family hydrolase [Ilumatobacteraceae bacterium]